jgi:hypothetical protein
MNPRQRRGEQRINTRSATRRGVGEPTGCLFSCVLLETLSPDPWGLPLWAGGRIKEKATL